MYATAPPPAAAQPAIVQQRRFELADVLSRWRAVELDLHDKGIDCESGILEHRTWRWLEMHIGDLIADPDTRIGRQLRALT